MTTFDDWLNTQLGTGLVGTVIYDENEDSYQLSTASMGIGLCEPLWERYQGKKVRIRIEVLDEN